jgi:hypothetical protein
VYSVADAGCFDLHGRADAILAPCDDNATASHGAQAVALNLAAIPRSWLGLQARAGVPNALVTCDVFDILATPKTGSDLGRHADGWAPVLPPHSVRFLRVSNCSCEA